MEVAFEFPVVLDCTGAEISWLGAAIPMENFPLVIVCVRLERGWPRMRMKVIHHERGEHDAERTSVQERVGIATCMVSPAWACIVVVRRKTEMSQL